MDRIQLRRDTAARWSQYNPVLLEGEVGYETDTKLRKIGDGVTKWNSLPYLRAEGVVQTTGDSTTEVMSQKAVSDIIDECIDDIQEIKTTLTEGVYSLGIKVSGTSYELPVAIKANTDVTISVEAEGVLTNGEDTPLYYNGTENLIGSIGNGTVLTFTPKEDVTKLVLYTRGAGFISKGRVQFRIQNNYIHQEIDAIKKTISNTENVDNSYKAWVADVNTSIEVYRAANLYTTPFKLLANQSYEITVEAEGVLVNGKEIPLYYNGTSKLIGSVGNGVTIKFTPSSDVSDFSVYTREAGFISSGKVNLKVRSSVKNEKLYDELCDLFNAKFVEAHVTSASATYTMPCVLTKDKRYRVVLHAEGVISSDISLGGVSLYYNNTGNYIGNISDGTEIEFTPKEDVENLLVYVRQAPFIAAGDIRMFVNSYNDSIIEDSLVENTFTGTYNSEPIKDKSEEFAELYATTEGDVEPFVYFTDAHILTEGITDIEFKKSMSLVEKYYNSIAANFVLCGGDWYNSDLKKDALFKLSYIDGFLKKLFKKYYPIFGNHDNNYQGKLDENSAAQTGTISEQQMINLMYRDYGKKYYTFRGTSTRFYVFDSGIDWNTEMDGYRWEQVDFFAKGLLQNDDSHNVVALHIFCNQGNVDTWDTYVTPFADNLTLLMDAYNNKRSVTLGGKQYDFSATLGKCHCVICGHTHYDNMSVRNNIPVFCTTQFKKNYTGVTTFDLIILDYGANRLRSIRVGDGENREMELAN